MRPILWFLLAAAISSFNSTAGPLDMTVNRNPAVQSGRLFTNLPLHFEINQGQADPGIKFLARGPRYAVLLTSTDAVLALPAGMLHMKLAGTGGNAEITGLEELPARSHYFLGNDPQMWHRNIANYRKVRYRNVYPGIDFVCYGDQGKLEYDFVVAAGAHPELITLAFDGAVALKVDSTADLVLTLPNGEEIRMKRPLAYQQLEGMRKEVSSEYRLQGNNQVGFQLGAYDHNQELIIDPVVYSTYLGGHGNDSGNGIKMDSQGYVYLTGSTSSSDFPVVDPFQPALHVGDPMTAVDAYVSKLSPTGDALIYSTYIGGLERDVSSAIAVDQAGNVYIAGQTSSPDFPTVNAVQGSRGVNEDAFVAKLNASGNALVYSTYLGGTNPDWRFGIAVDGNGQAAVTGFTESTNFPTTPSAFQVVAPGSPASLTLRNAFVTKFTIGGSAFVYSSYLGGGGHDTGRAIDMDSAGNAYVAGDTSSTDFPTMNALQPRLSGLNDAFVTRLDTSGSVLIYSTYLGGSAGDAALGIDIDADGRAYVVGSTASANFPVARPVQRRLAGGTDAFLAKIESTGMPLIYSTYFGGSGDDRGGGIAADAEGNAFVVGTTASMDFPVANPIQASYGGSDDAFVAEICAAGRSIGYSTYLGGSSFEGGNAIAVDPVKDIAVVTGFTWSTDFPVENPLQLDSPAADAFITKIQDPAAASTLRSCDASAVDAESSRVRNCGCITRR